MNTSRSRIDTAPPRYEFRVWGDLDRLAAAVASRIDDAVDSVGDECYLLAPPNSGVNPKIRDGMLDVKRLLRVRRSCEQWEPVEKASFPLDTTTISASLFDVIGLEPPPLTRDGYDLDQFMAEVVRPHPRIDAVPVDKVRTVGSAGICRAEIARVTIAGTFSTTTVAIESSDLDALVALRTDFGLGGAANESYPHAIRRIVGSGVGDARRSRSGR